MSKELNLVRKEYCFINKIPDDEATQLYEQKKNPVTGDFTFLIVRPGIVPEIYNHVRKDISNFSGYKPLSLPKDMQTSRDAMLNKQAIATWINRHLNLEMLEDDIGVLLIENSRIFAVMSVNSMRFKNTLTITLL